MNTKERIEVTAEFAIELQRRSKSKSGACVLARDVARLVKMSNELHSLGEAASNYGLSKARETRFTNLERAALALLKEYGIKAHVQGDPRGWPIVIGDEEHALSALRVPMTRY